ncbi:hypothetical protein F4782DRAFT_540805 [Xylaria castorea]|nr:hypothetical protein F4782DRAFT_540805 [Xylaria castorea]
MRVSSVADVASNLLARFEGKTRIESQLLDGNQLRKLSLTLGRRDIHLGVNIEPRAPNAGTVLPPGYHLVDFSPGGIEVGLGADGSDVMSEDVALRIGDEVEERTRLLGATPKRSRDGSEIVLVQVEKEFWGPRGLALVDERSWVFRPEAAAPSPAAEKALRDAVIRGLFRFSELTFNGHKIHYDPIWNAAVESHPASVVHGPLDLISMLDYWRDHCAAGKRVAQEIRYRAVAPVYAGETYEISAVLLSKEGRACMTGSILGL